MLWNVIYDFFIHHVFGGYDNNNVGVNVYFGRGYSEQTWQFTRSVEIELFGKYLTLGNYFSLIATIITMVAILLFCVFIIKKIIGIIFRLFTGSSSF